MNGKVQTLQTSMDTARREFAKILSEVQILRMGPLMALCGAWLGFAVIVGLAIYAKMERIPTQQDENDLTNKLNRIALDRANRKDTK